MGWVQLVASIESTQEKAFSRSLILLRRAMSGGMMRRAPFTHDAIDAGTDPPPP